MVIIFLRILSFIFFVSIVSCSTFPISNYKPLRVVLNVDIEKYLGKWYEIARYPNWFQENCYAVTADYDLNEDNSIRVINRCRNGSLSGKWREAIGSANVVDQKTNAKLKVSFFWPFYGDYWIIELDNNYEYVVVSEPTRKYLWILNRQPFMESTQYNRVLKILSDKGFDVSVLINTPQNKI